MNGVISRSPTQQAFRRFAKNRFALICASVFATIVLATIVVPMATGHDPTKNNLKERLKPPTREHFFGTDAMGRDLFTRVFWGCRITFIIGIAATILGVTIGIIYGGISGYVGGTTDNLMMRFVDVLYGLPLLVYTMLLINVFKGYWEPLGFSQETRWEWNIILIFLAVGSIGWLTTARIVRGQVLSLKEQEFVQSARALGASGPRTLFIHIVPNLLGPVVVYSTLTLPSVMLFESFISFLGLGVEPPNASLGLLIDDGVKQLMPTDIYWWLLVFPSAILAVSLFCLNAVGDGLRDALDVQAKENA